MLLYISVQIINATILRAWLLIEYRQVIFHLIFCIKLRLGNEIVGKFRMVLR